MTIKEYLGQAYRLDQRINSKLEQLESLNSLAMKCTLSHTGMPKNPTHSTSMMAEIVAKIVDLQSKINQDIDLLVDLKSEIVRVIKNVNRAEYQTLLELRYLCFKTWEQIAVDLNYSIDNVYRIHRKALRAASLPKSVQ